MMVQSSLMMTKVIYNVDNQTGAIYWAAAEQFVELRGTVYKLGEMEAIQIEKINNLSLTAKILLSAVAGALIQHLMDKGMSADAIFEKGSFVVEA